MRFYMRNIRIRIIWADVGLGANDTHGLLFKIKIFLPKISINPFPLIWYFYPPKQSSISYVGIKN